MTLTQFVGSRSSFRMFQVADAGGAGGAGGGGGTTDAGTGGGDPAAAAAAASATPDPAGTPAAGAGAAAAAGALPDTGNKELRTHFEGLLAKSNQTIQTLQSQITKFEAAQARIARAFGAPTEQEEQTQTERAQIREAMLEMFPELNEIESLRAVRNQFLNQYGQSTMKSVFEQYEKTYGVAPNDAGQKHLHRMYVGWLQSDKRLADRYENHDANLVKEFFEDLNGGLLQGARVTRNAAASGGRGSGAPRGGTTSPAITGTPARKSFGGNLDKAAEEMARQLQEQGL